ncbi:MAG: hypothetical protein LBK67_08790 [Coriobacteriales bacterium]|jgi:TPR repeat protein|nr:hypothetical protein [Coriobacteriales bacterium]
MTELTDEALAEAQPDEEEYEEDMLDVGWELLLAGLTQEAIEYFETCAEEGSTKAMDELALILDGGLLEPIHKYDDSIPSAEPDAAIGCASDCSVRYDYYDHSELPGKDPDSARSWWRKAAQAGDWLGLLNYATVLEDRNEAFALLGLFQKNEAELQHQPWYGHVLRLFGEAYDLGQGVERDTERARMFYQRAASSEFYWEDRAMWRLGDLLVREATDIYANPEAFAWYKRAMDYGSDEGALAVARCYETGLGVSKDRDIAASICRQIIRQAHDENVDLAQESLKRITAAKNEID